MTSGGENLLDKIQDEFCECKICFNEYNEEKNLPRILPCFHTICSECIKALCKKRDKITCPLCNKVHEMKTKDILIFPKDNTRRNLKEVLDKFVGEFCGVCQKPDRVSYYCNECLIRLCRKCYMSRKLNVCRNHLIKNEDDVDQPSISPNTFLETRDKSEIEICTLKGHEHNELKFYCYSKGCDKPICSNCATQSHKNHMWEELRDFYDRRRNSFSKHLINTKQKLEYLRRIIEKISQEKISSRKSAKKDNQNPRRPPIQRGLKFLNAQEAKIVQRITNGKMDVLDRTLTKLQNYLENAQECCYISDKMLEENVPFSFLSVENTLRDTLKSFSVTLEDEGKETTKSTQVSVMKKRINWLEKRSIKESYICRMIVALGNLLRIVCRLGTTVIRSLMIVIVFFCTFALAVVLFFGTFCEINGCDDSTVSFGYSNKNITSCISSDQTMFSTFPLGLGIDQMCGSRNDLLVFNGVFLNKSLSMKNNYSVTMHFTVSNISNYSKHPNLFQIGISDGSIYKYFHYMENRVHGWHIGLSSHKKEIFIASTKMDFAMYVPVLASEEHSVYGKLQLIKVNNILKLKYFDTIKNEFFEIDRHKIETNASKYVFISFFEQRNAIVTISCTDTNMRFNESSADSNIFFSDDKSIVSNKYMGTKSMTESIDHIQDLMIHNCSTFCVLYFKLKFEQRHSGTMFELQFTNIGYTRKTLKSMSLLTDTDCTQTDFLFFTSKGKCLRTNPDISRYRFPNILTDDWIEFFMIIDRNNRKFYFKADNQELEFKIPIFLNGNRPRLRIKLFKKKRFTLVIENRDNYPWHRPFTEKLSKLFNIVLAFLLKYILPLMVAYAIYRFIKRINVGNDDVQGRDPYLQESDYSRRRNR